MTLLDNMTINGFSIIILVFIIVYYHINADRGTSTNKLFMIMLQFTVLMLVVDSMGRFDGSPATYHYFVNHLGNFLLFLFSPVIPSLWLIYVHCYIFPAKRISRFISTSLIIVNVTNVVMTIGTQFNGWFYTIDPVNHYSRGPLYPVSPAMTIFLLLAATGYIFFYRSRIERSHYIPFLLFPATPFAGLILQCLIYGYPFTLMGMVCSVLMITFFAQSIETNVDYLSGAYNRKRLESYLRKKITSSGRNHTFSAIMADVNGLKQINDTFGHTIGDEALVTISSLIRSLLRSNDFVARYGGDEFCIVLDTANEEMLKTVVDKINRQLANYNEMSLKPYQLGLSMGYAVYDPDSNMSAKEFYNTIDAMMYEDKKRHHLGTVTKK